MPSPPDVLFGILFFDPQRHVTQDDLRGVTKLIGAPTADLEIDRNFGVGIQRHVVAPDAQSPGVSRSADLCVALTGEIENRAELVAELARRGTRPATDLDADLVAALWSADGEGAAAATHGYFNAVVWARARRELVLLVDRCAGVKSLSYHRSADRLVFGSTIKAVLAHAHVPRALDPSALEDLLVLRHPVSPRTMLASVSTLEAGTSLAVRGDAITLRRYWRRRPWRPGAADVATLERDYLAALERAVARSAGTDDAHVMLSGGVDSAVLVALLRRLGTRRVLTYSVHIGDAEAGERAAAREIARLFATDHRSLAVTEGIKGVGGVDILVNNAGNAGGEGWPGMKPFVETEPADWDPFLRVNLYGVMYCMRAALPEMIHKRYGRIVTIVSDAGRIGESHMGAYCAAKAGAAGLTRGVAREVGRHGITANNIALGTMRTPMSEALWSNPDNPQAKALMKPYIIRRPGDPSDPAGLTAYLVSPMASWITGQTFPVNGGYSVTQ